MSDENLPPVLWHQSGVNKQGEPFVQLLLGEQIIGQMTPEEARDHARAMTESAEAAEQDFRRYRAERTGKRGGPTNPRDWVKP